MEFDRLADATNERCVILAFDYSDGPETGLLVLPNGEASRFAPIADSPSRLTRAFAFTMIDGNWSDKLAGFQSKNEDFRILVPGPSPRLSALERDVSTAKALAHYVGLADLSFNRLRLCRVVEREQSELLAMNGSPAAFTLTQELARTRKRTAP